jgi:prepilin-type N-terminal cleavage/methylation domain-containing protein
MKKPPCSRHKSGPAFTLIELLVVIGIIALLASMILPAIHTIKIREQVSRTRLQVGMIASAIQNYESDYGRLPFSTDAMNAAAGASEDFTFGGTFKTPGGATFEVAGPSAVSTKYKASNAEIMAILFDMEKYQNGQPTVNVGHVKNPKRNNGYLAAHFVSDTVSPGIGSDGVYRDLWGNPYVITLDLNNDGKTRDAFYRTRSISQITSGKPVGYFGLFNSFDTPAGNGDHYECNSPVTVWSAGPDQMINPNDPANAGANKDNILSWK